MDVKEPPEYADYAGLDELEEIKANESLTTCSDQGPSYEAPLYNVLEGPAMTTLVQVLSCMMSWGVLIRTPLVLLIRALSPLCMRSWRALIQRHKMSSFICEVVYFAIVYLGRHAIFWGGWVRGWKSSR